MVSPVDVCNMALGQIGAQVNISALDGSDSTPAADVCRLYYQTKINSLMRAAPWNFTRKTAALTLLRQAYDPTTGQASTDPPAVPFLYEYLYPSDCRDARFMPRLWTGSPTQVPLTTAPASMFIPPIVAEIPANFVVAQGIDTSDPPAQIKVILTNEANAILVYTAQVDNPDLWDSNFLDAAVATLAATLVNPLGRNASLLKQNVELARSIVADARVSDGNEGLNNQDHTPDWIQIRGSYGGAGGMSGNSWDGLWTWSAMSWPDGLSY